MYRGYDVFVVLFCHLFFLPPNVPRLRCFCCPFLPPFPPFLLFFSSECSFSSEFNFLPTALVTSILAFLEFICSRTFKLLAFSSLFTSGSNFRFFLGEFSLSFQEL